MKGVANGANHEKKGNKRPPAEERLYSLNPVYLYSCSEFCSSGLELKGL